MDDKKTIEILLKLNDQMGAQLSAQTKNMNEAAAAAEHLAKSVNETTAANKAAISNDKLLKSVKKSSTASKEHSGHVEHNASAIGGATLKLAGMAAAYISVSSAINYAEAAIASVIATGSEFEKSMSGTRAILQPTKEEFDALKISARAWRKYGFLRFPGCRGADRTRKGRL